MWALEPPPDDGLLTRVRCAMPPGTEGHEQNRTAQRGDSERPIGHHRADLQQRIRIALFDKTRQLEHLIRRDASGIIDRYGCRVASASIQKAAKRPGGNGCEGKWSDGPQKALEHLGAKRCSRLGVHLGNQIRDGIGRLVTGRGTPPSIAGSHHSIKGIIEFVRHDRTSRPTPAAGAANRTPGMPTERMTGAM